MNLIDGGHDRRGRSARPVRTGMNDPRELAYLGVFERNAESALLVNAECAKGPALVSADELAVEQREIRFSLLDNRMTTACA